MTSSKPYLFRGLYEWLLDNEATPYVLVDANSAELRIPQGIAADGKLVLNLSPGAVQQLEMTNDYLSFSARFSGVAQDVYCPMSSVLAIYARENGEGMMFAGDAEQAQADGGKNLDNDAPEEKRNKPGLKIVK
ncbi:MAG: ClpXP protease specificity-enhancing factor [Gammaproteobacteria bacterium]|nr:ClpXP protease specificity-enhancing factor [Gammaproteobacteria bacterium]